MSPEAAWFRRTPWREAVRGAPPESLAGWRLVGPAGVLADRLHGATTPLRRMRGLLGRPPLAPGEAFLIRPCSQVHTIGMRYAIDVVFCDRDLRVLAVEHLPPGRMSRLVRRAWGCFEVPGGTAERAGVEPGVELRLEREP